MQVKVLFVCHGNICRSPMAEFVMKKKVADAGLSEHFLIASAATSDEEIWNGVGNPVYPPARDELRRHGIGCEGKRAVQIRRNDYDEYDYLIGMDSANIRNMRRLWPDDPEGKISMLLDYTDQPGSVADPWYTRDFTATWNDVNRGCDGLLRYLKEREGL